LTDKQITVPYLIWFSFGSYVTVAISEEREWDPDAAIQTKIFKVNPCKTDKCSHRQGRLQTSQQAHT